jgi:dephospho-CoA kinase
VRASPQRSSVVVGLTGGIGAGKSEALRAFERHGAAVLSSDAVVRGLYARPEVREAVVRRFGRRVLAEDGTVDRGALGRIVFADATELRWLEGLVLPLVSEEFVRWRAEHERMGTPLLVHEAPTLFEAGVEDRYDTIVAITAPEDERERRRPGASERMAHQLPEAEKAARADVVYENSGSLEDLDAFVARLVERIRRR